MNRLVGKRAVVIGGGIAGLLSARVLADHFESVIVLERDSLPIGVSNRQGTPQDKHLHGLLSKGLQSFCDLLPGFEKDLADAGAVALRVGLDMRMERPGYDPFPQREAGWVGYSMTRPLLESVARRRVKAVPNIAFYEQCRVREIVKSGRTENFDTVLYVAPDGTNESVQCDFIIDASGQGKLTLAALQSEGRPLPEESIIEVDISYGTAIFEIPVDAPTDWKGVMTFPKVPEGSRGGIVNSIEGNRWIVSVSDRHGNKVPGEWDEFLAFVKSLRTQTIYNAIKNANRVGKVERFGFSANRRRHFERLDSFPRGLLPIGDALAQLNPVAAQGMTIAAQEACLLKQLLADRSGIDNPLDDFAPAFFKGSQAIIDISWATSAIPDLIFPQTKGDRPPEIEKAFKFSQALIRLAAKEPDVHKLYLETFHLLKPPSVFRDPELVKRVQQEMMEN